MADISKCIGGKCRLRNTCYRFTALGGYWQSYIEPAYKVEKRKTVCENYMKNPPPKKYSVGHKDCDRVFRGKNQ